jgi:cytochrome c peroxidase
MKSIILLIRGIAVLVVVFILTAAGGAADYIWNKPAWVPTPVVPADNQMSYAKVELGRYLFYDKRLSLDNTMSCGSCHQQDKAFTDGKALSPGVDKKDGVRSAMMLGNVVYMPVLTWANPNVKQLEKQMLVPMFGENPTELGMIGQEQELFNRLATDPRYQKMFKQAFPEVNGEISLSTITKAIACFERTLISFDSPYDHYKYGGDPNAITPAAKRGEKLFFGEELECSHCHGGFNFTDNIQYKGLAFSELGFHNTGLYNADGKGAYPVDNPGIFAVTGNPSDMGKFRTPSLRNIALTAPYMHDGSITTLYDVIRKHYSIKGKAVYDGYAPNPLRDQFIEGFKISDTEIADLIAFLNSLTDKHFVSDPKFSDPYAVPDNKSASK